VSAPSPDPAAPEPADGVEQPPGTQAGPPNGTGLGPPAIDDAALAATADALSSPELAEREQRGLVTQLVRQAAGSLPRWRPGAMIRWATDTITEITPALPVRDLSTLRRQHGGLDGDALAERLIRNAARATAGVGAASGGMAAVKWTAPPTLLSAPVLLGVETVVVVAIEVKLIGELHHAYRAQLPDGGPEQAVALLQSWSQQRGVNPLMPGFPVAVVLGTTARNQLRDRLARRFGRNLTTLGPLLTGAAVASYLNQRATRSLGHQLRVDLRRQW
jgi:hypothetical protein